MRHIPVEIPKYRAAAAHHFGTHFGGLRWNWRIVPTTTETPISPGFAPEKPDVVIWNCRVATIQ
jgi:hypothetical protein